jgi:DNA-nicking Smr family endonuclease
VSEDDERRLFEEAMRDVKRLAHEKRRAPRESPPLPGRGQTASGGDAALDPEVVGEQVSAFDPSVRPATRRALRQGSPPPEATLDLHGATSKNAAFRLETFLRESRAAGRRVLLVITGRGLRSGEGGPVVRSRVVEALGRAPLASLVLGFTSAPPSLGGAGALLVLLRKR